MPFFKIWFYRLWFNINQIWNERTVKLGLLIWGIINVILIGFWWMGFYPDLSLLKYPWFSFVLNHHTFLSIFVFINVFSCLGTMIGCIVFGIQKKALTASIDTTPQQWWIFFKTFPLGMKMFCALGVLGIAVTPFLFFLISFLIGSFLKKFFKIFNIKSNIKAKNDNFLKAHPELEAKLLAQKLDKTLPKSTATSVQNRL